mmetsp:Transcript_7937/g.26368  ORF Transcript_7937/g.26368 Transcript_7937/m.26368 type:complete len:425 (+) Transcript_7937:2108-3382(+)
MRSSVHKGVVLQRSESVFHLCHERGASFGGEGFRTLGRLRRRAGVLQESRSKLVRLEVSLRQVFERFAELQRHVHHHLVLALIVQGTRSQGTDMVFQLSSGQEGGCRASENEARVVERSQRRPRAQRGALALHRSRHHRRLGVSRREHDRRALTVVRHRPHPNRHHEPVPNLLDSAEVARRRCRRLVVDGRERRRLVQVHPTAVERHVPVRPDPAEEEANPAEGSDPVLVSHAKSVHRRERRRLLALALAVRRPQTQREIDAPAEELAGVRPRLAPERPRIDRERLFRVEAEALDIVALHVRPEAVGLLRVDGVKLVNLDKGEAAHIGLPARRVHAPRAQLRLHLRGVPSAQQALHVPNEVLGGAPRRQRNHATRVALHPLQKTQRHQLAQLRKCIHFQHRDLFRWCVAKLPTAALLQGERLDL